MPPKKFRNKYPDKLPTQDEKKALIDWAREYAKKLAEE